MIQLIFPTSI